VKLKPVRSSILRALGKFGGRSRDLKTGTLIQGAWQEIVGELMSRYCHPIQVVGSRLKIGVTSPVWLSEMDYFKDTLLDNIQKTLGSKVITEVSFSMIERVPAALPMPLESRIEDVHEPSTDESEKMEQALSSIADPELRERMRRVLKKSLARYGNDPESGIGQS
jgi:hypothetical protein